MTDLKTILSCGAAFALALQTFHALAQDDLDDLLKDLDSEASAPVATAAPVAEETKAEEPAKNEASEEDEKEEPSEESKPVAEANDEAEEKPAAEELKVKAEDPKAEALEQTAEAEDAADAASSAKDVDEVLNLLDKLAEENEPEVPKTEGQKELSAAAAKMVAAPKPVAKPKRVRPDEELLTNIATTERLRRSALDEQAQREIRDARACMQSEEFSDAIRHYGLALKFLNDSPKSAAFRRECNQGVTEGLYRAALQDDEIGRRAAAIELMQKALARRHPNAGEMLEKWKDQSAAAEGRAQGESDYTQVRSDADYKKNRAQYRRHLRRARQYLALRDMSRALDECEIVLREDPYNQEALRLRKAIQEKRQTILEQERKATRDGMIADVDEAWRPVYAVNASQLSAKSSETVKAQMGEDPERTMEQDIEKRMREMRIPEIDFKPPATIIDAVEFFRSASRDYDRPDIPLEKRGFNFVLRTPVGAIKQAAVAEEDSNDFSSNASEESTTSSNGLPPIPMIKASDISFYDALKLVCDSVDYKFIVRGPIVMVLQKDMSTAELLSRKYNVPAAFGDRVEEAYNEIKESGGFGSASGNAKRRNASDDEEGNDDDKWKAFFEQMGVKWPEGSSIKRIKSLGKLYVRNTRENLAEFEKVLDELGGQPQLIEIETRFVEVSQEDLNSLGFEWILNSDYSLNLGNKLGKALGVKNGTWGSLSDRTTETISGSNTAGSETSGTQMDGMSLSSTATTTHSTQETGSSRNYSRTETAYGSQNGTWISGKGSKRNIGINSFGGTESGYGNGNRYLSTTSNHISGESNSTNDQFFRVNAFLGQADLSMILHMLSQRSDTDLLSAPKVVTKSGEQAVIKVVTEYIYPTDYDVQLQSSSSGSSGSSSGSSQSAILAVVEPQNFTMREVGVILDVTPTYSEANGGTIDLELKPAVVDEPTWHNYGMKIPFTGNTSSLETFAGIAEIPTAAVNAVLALGGTLTEDIRQSYQNAILNASTTAMSSVGESGAMTWYDAPMEQPFFHVRSIDSKVSITPGSTVVMGGLITESRKAMDDKIPFLGDLPFIGRLFRSHAEQTIKRNLLIFVTGRLITPSGRELTVNTVTPDDAEIKSAPNEK